MIERLSSTDGTLVRDFGVHIQRYRFAQPYCVGKTVLDAGCGVGYGTVFLARHGASRVTGVDISADALGEARTHHRDPNVEFVQGDLGALASIEGLPQNLDTVVSFENIEHLTEPVAFLDAAVKRLSRPGGCLVISTPNGDISECDEFGRLANAYHVHEFNLAELSALLSPRFSQVAWFGQWETADRRLRIMKDRHVFDQLCEGYYNPMVRLGRYVKRLCGREVAGPPQYTAGHESYSCEYVIERLEARRFPGRRPASSRCAIFEFPGKEPRQSWES